MMSFTLFLTLGGNLTANAATVDDLRELMGKQRVDSKYSPTEQREILLEYTKIENHNRVANMFHTSNNLDTDSEKDKLRSTLQSEVDKQKETLAVEFSSGGSVEDVLKVKTNLTSLQYQLSKLGQKGTDISMDFIENTWKYKYDDLMESIRESSNYVNLGSVGSELESPVKGYFTITSLFGDRVHPITGVRHTHKGLDLLGAIGDDVLVLWDGTVTAVTESKAGGRIIEVDHGDGVKTRYLHLSQRLAYVGQEVKQYDRIGKVGDTGEVTGPHLHFEVYVDGEAVDPIYFFGQKSVKALKDYSSNVSDDEYTDLSQLISTIKEYPENMKTDSNIDEDDSSSGVIYHKSGEDIEGALSIKIGSGHSSPNPSDVVM